MLPPALRREITLLSPTAMPFMPQQRDSNVSREEGALLPVRGCGRISTAERAQTAPAHSIPTERPGTEHPQNGVGGGWRAELGAPPAEMQSREPAAGPWPSASPPCWGSTAA